MIQQIIPGLEAYWGLNNSEEVIVTDSENHARGFMDIGFEYLSDWNSGELLARRGDGPYIPERIAFPSGKVLDELELLDELKKTPLGDPLRKELEQGFYFFHSIQHAGTDSSWKNDGISFVSKGDEIKATKKYNKRPFF